MNKFPEELSVPLVNKMIIDRTRLLIALKKPYEIEEIKNLLQGTEFVLEEGVQKNKEPMKLINHTDKRFWIRSNTGKAINQENLDRLKEVFGVELDWIGPVYRSSNEREGKGSFCPLPNVLIIKFSPSFDDKDNEFSRKFARYNLEEVTEKSKYLGAYRYYVIKNIENENAYQIKDILLNEIRFVREVLFENMPMMSPADLIPNDSLFSDLWNMTRIQAGGAGTTAWDFSTGGNNVVICIIDTGCDLTHPDLQFSTPGIHLDTLQPDGSPFGTNSGHGTACAGIAAATFNNVQGVSGVAGNCRIMPLAFITFSDIEAAAGINYAVANGAQVISMSFSFNTPSVAIDAATKTRLTMM